MSAGSIDAPLDMFGAAEKTKATISGRPISSCVYWTRLRSCW